MLKNDEKISGCEQKEQKDTQSKDEGSCREIREIRVEMRVDRGWRNLRMRFFRKCRQ